MKILDVVLMILVCLFIAIGVINFVKSNVSVTQKDVMIPIISIEEVYPPLNKETK